VQIRCGAIVLDRCARRPENALGDFPMLVVRICCKRATCKVTASIIDIVARIRAAVDRKF
jgi:hypothetical protein